jgi:hypothetical protein
MPALRPTDSGTNFSSPLPATFVSLCVFRQSRNPDNIRKQPNNPFKFRDGIGNAIKLPA